jgi:hypothetical protein
MPCPLKPNHDFRNALQRPIQLSVADCNCFTHTHQFGDKMKTNLVLFAALLSLSGTIRYLPAHQPPAPLVSDVESTAKAELLAIHKDARRAHFEHDVDAILAGTSESSTSVRDGKVQVRSRDDVRKQFAQYFQGTQFSTWDDLEPPIIQVSPDGKMGWMIVRVRIAYTKTDASGAQSKEDTVMAWMSVYEKRDGKWLHVANASTTAP